MNPEIFAYLAMTCSNKRPIKKEKRARRRFFFSLRFCGSWSSLSLLSCLLSFPMTPASVAKMAESPTASASASAARRVSTFVPSAIKEPTWLHGSWVPQQQTSSSGSNCFNLLASSSTDSDEDLKDLEWDVQKMTFGVGELDDRTDAPLCKIFYTVSYRRRLLYRTVPARIAISHMCFCRRHVSFKEKQMR